MPRIFLSYSWSDDDPLQGGTPGWVSQFLRALEADLGHVRCKVDIWRDIREMPGHERFDNVLKRELEAADLLLICMSTSWMGSEHCPQELDWFLQSNDDRPDRRVFIVRKGYVAPAEQPKSLDKVLGWVFYEDEEDRPGVTDPRKLLELPVSGDPTSKFRRKLRDLSLTINDRVAELSNVAADRATETQDKGVVFLARATPDTLSGAERLGAELHSAGFRVRELKDAWGDREAIEADIRDAVSSAVATVHVIGRDEARVPNGADVCLTEFQLDLAAEMARQRDDLHRVVWITPQARAAKTHGSLSPRQADLLKRVEEEKRDGTEHILTGAQRHVATQVLEILLRPGLPDGSPEGGKPVVYVLFTQQDSNNVVGLFRHLRGNDLDVRAPYIENESGGYIRRHARLLELCDGVLLYWGKAPDDWSMERITEITDATRCREKTLASSAAYVRPPPTKQKQLQEYSDELKHWILAFDEEEYDRLGPFIDEVRGAQRTRA